MRYLWDLGFFFFIFKIVILETLVEILV